MILFFSELGRFWTSTGHVIDLHVVDDTFWDR